MGSAPTLWMWPGGDFRSLPRPTFTNTGRDDTIASNSLETDRPARVVIGPAAVTANSGSLEHNRPIRR